MNRTAGGHSVMASKARPKEQRERDALSWIPLIHTPRDDPNGPRNPVRAAPVSPSTGRRAGVLDGFCTVGNGAKAEALQRLAPVYGGPSLCCAGALTKTGL